MLKLLDFTAAWCPPCQIMDPIIEELKVELKDKVEIEELDVDSERDKAKEFMVMSVPTYVIVRDEQEVDRKSGAMSKHDMLAWIQGFLKE